MGLGLLSSPVSSTVDLAAQGPSGPGVGGRGVFATNSSAPAAQPALSPDMSSASTLSPDVASLVCLRPLHSAIVLALLREHAESARQRCLCQLPCM